MINDEEFGMMASLKGDKIVSVALQEGVGELKTVPPELYKTVEVLFSQ